MRSIRLRRHLLLTIGVVLVGVGSAQAHTPGKSQQRKHPQSLAKSKSVAHHRVVKDKKSSYHRAPVSYGKKKYGEFQSSHYRHHMVPAVYGKASSSELTSKVGPDSLTPGAMQLLHLSPVAFAGVGAAPQPSPLGRIYSPTPIPRDVPSVSSPDFINAALILAKIPAESPAAVASLHPMLAGAAPESPEPVAAQENKDIADVPAHNLRVAVEMLASQAYHWASSPLVALEQNGDLASGADSQNQLRNDVALAAQEASGSQADTVGSSWLSPSGLVASALKFIGAPYVWGGVSPRTGFDCSGFVKYILAKFDIVVPRTSYAQAASLPAISRSDLKPGDLVFFNTMHRAFSHVGIYIGHGKFVSAQTPATGVQVASLRDPYWAARFDGARRLPRGINLS